MFDISVKYDIIVLIGDNMLKPRDYLMYELRSYASPKSKLTQMIKKGEVIQIVRGVYATSPTDPRLPAAGMIKSPSYISFETALGYHQMIPEAVYGITSAGFRLTKETYYDTPFGRYTFRYIPEAAFHLALIPAVEQGHGFRLATKEKALTDTLYKIRGVRSLTWMEALLFEDLRLDRDDIATLNWDLIRQLVPYYRSTTLKTLVAWRNNNE